jgi:CTP:molybdopterin cytidylyltransferase MocA
MMSHRTKAEISTGFIILAAGGSTRMGMPKQLLDAGGVPLFRRVLDLVLEFCPDPVLVYGAVDLRPDLVGRYESIRMVENADWQAGQLGSLQKGLKAADTSDRYLVFLADLPWLSKQTVRALLDIPSDASAAYPVHDGRRGHPVLLGREAAGLVLAASPSDRAMRIIKPLGPREVPVDDAGIWRDIDTPQEYRAAFPRQMPAGGD